MIGCSAEWSERMCPVCLTTAAIIAAGTGAAGGLISLLVVRLERGSTADKSILRNEENAS